LRDRYERAGGVSSPAFSLRFSGPVIVAGNAWCLHDDISEARKTWPDAPVIACNGAAREVKAIALYSRHPERFTEHPYDWIGRQRRKFGDGFTVHSSNIERNGAAAGVDYWWEDARGGGGSAWGARKTACLMGFDFAILCGAPLAKGNYVGQAPGLLMTRDSVINDLRQGILDEPEWFDGCCSMSGWTRDVLG
jgi:hypothetical protein